MLLCAIANRGQVRDYFFSKLKMFKNAFTLSIAQSVTPPKPMKDTPLVGAVCAAIHRCTGLLGERSGTLWSVPYLRMSSLVGFEVLWLVVEAAFLPSLFTQRTKGGAPLTFSPKRNGVLCTGLHPIFLLRTMSVTFHRAPVLLYAYFLIDHMRGNQDGYLQVCVCT